jgi:hypothetical protein
LDIEELNSQAGTRILRSVLMKPEAPSHFAALQSRLERRAGPTR